MEDKIFSVTDENFEVAAIDVFHFQYKSNVVYQSWVNTLGIDPRQINRIRPNSVSSYRLFQNA